MANPNYSTVYTSAFPGWNLAKGKQWVQKYWFQGLLLCLALHVLFAKDISIDLTMQHAGGDGIAATDPADPQTVDSRASKTRQGRVAAGKKTRANDFFNLSFVLNPTYAKRKGIDQAIVREKWDNCQRYITTYREAAQAEMTRFGIPASITLAQALLESDAGASRLARESNNHFGLKCRSKCLDCTCRNYADDDIYDMFRVFDSPWESFREHSLHLTGERYQHLHKLGRRNYEKWAHGLQEAGYATDKRYADKLIRIIKTLKLHRYDR